MAATLDLEDLVDAAKAELTVPGVASFTNSTTAQWVAQLQGAFWEAVLDGVITGYDELDGSVFPQSGGTVALSRELQQVVIYYVGIRVLKATLLNLKTKFSAKAGPVAYETQQSANVLSSLLEEWISRRNIWLARLSDIGSSPSYYVDMVVARDESISFGNSSWWG